MVGIKSPKDFWAGLFYLCVSGGAYCLANGLPIGSLQRMGAGYLPVMLSALLALFGVIAVFRSLMYRGAKLDPVAWRPLVMLVLAIALFALLLPLLGFVLSLTILVFICARTSRWFRLSVPNVLMMIAFIAANSLVFVVLLKIPVPLWGAWLTRTVVG